VLVDEVCGALDATDCLARFRAPMFRDGAVIGSVLYTVDGTNLWSLDVSDPSGIPRKSLIAGFGTPIAMGIHGGKLVIAAGAQGVLLVDVTDPEAPVRAAAVELEGPALDVHVDGDRAFAAMGKAGIAVIDLLASPPAVSMTIPIEGFAAGVTAQGSTASVAACDSFAVVDTTQGKVIGTTWLEKAHVREILVAPAKDVAIAGSTAYVAAGRFGAVGIDVANPAEPAVPGNCTVEKELSFYASGVRAQNGKLFVAGGEWGVLPIDLGAGGCPTLVDPVLPEHPVDQAAPEECSSKAPWEVVPWQNVWAPPAFGNAGHGGSFGDRQRAGDDRGHRARRGRQRERDRGDRGRDRVNAARVRSRPMGLHLLEGNLDGHAGRLDGEPGLKTCRPPLVGLRSRNHLDRCFLAALARDADRVSLRERPPPACRAPSMEPPEHRLRKERKER
jgi:hypothetical protein